MVGNLSKTNIYKPDTLERAYMSYKIVPSSKQATFNETAVKRGIQKIKKN